MFNNKKLSDLTLKFANDNTLSVHKLILENLSETFKKAFENGEINENKEFLINKDEDEKILTSVVQFLYTGKFEYSSEDEIINFLIYGHKVLSF
jgi:hypothetical protein